MEIQELKFKKKSLDIKISKSKFPNRGLKSKIEV